MKMWKVYEDNNNSDGNDRHRIKNVHLGFGLGEQKWEKALQGIGTKVEQ